MPFIPIKDENPHLWIRAPYVTIGLIAACVLIYLWESVVGAEITSRTLFGLGFIPATLLEDAHRAPDFTLVAPAVTLVTALFLHDGFMHVAGNMIMLWVFGDNVEDSMGHVRFLIYYIVCGIASTMIYGLSDPSSEVPLIGASGAISGVLGGYLMLHPRANIVAFLMFVVIRVPAFLLLLLWFGWQFLALWGDNGSGVAWWAHIGGFVVGAVLIVPFRHKAVPLLDGMLRRRRAGPWG
jgi:membrane associated rhomboid family serine protease